MVQTLLMIRDLLTSQYLKLELAGTYAENICDYSDGNIGDIITEIADNNTDIYTSDLLEWLKNNYSIVEEANQEFGTPSDIIKQCQQGQFYQYSNELFANINPMLQLYAYDYLDKNKIYLNVEQQEILDDYIESLDNNDYLEQIIDKITDLES